MNFNKHVIEIPTTIPDGAMVDGPFGGGQVQNGKIVIARSPLEGLKDKLEIFSQNGQLPEELKDKLKTSSQKGQLIKIKIKKQTKDI